MSYDQAQSPRLGQAQAPENPGVRIVTLAQLPEVAYRGQIVFLSDTDYMYVYDGAGWNAVGDKAGTRLIVSATDPSLTVTVAAGDQWYCTDSSLPNYHTIMVWNGSAWVQPGTATSNTGNKIRMRDDGSGGVIEFYTGDPDETIRGVFNPGAEVPPSPYTSAAPFIKLRTGSFGTERATIVMRGASASEEYALIELRSDDVYLGNNSSSNTYIVGQDGTGTVNAMLTGSGRVVRDTSSLKYKHDVAPLVLDKDVLLSLSPVTYRLNSEEDAGPVYPGFIAEDAAEKGLDFWVVTKDDEPDGFRYQAWTVALQIICQQQQVEMNEQQAEIDELKRDIADLKKQVAALTKRHN